MSGQFIEELRDLSEQERALLSALLGSSDAGRRYLTQVTDVRVVSRCGCGCRTVDLRIASATQALTGASSIVAWAQAESPEGVPLDLSIHVRDGEVAELEIYASDASENFNLPPADSLDLESSG